MASNSTPKLKVYRLENRNYAEAGDNDIQSLSNDEMIPIVRKDLNPFNTEEMVGVSSRQDGRVVCESAVDYAVLVPVSVGSGGYIESADRMLCEGWVLGKGNISVYVYRNKANAEDIAFDDTIPLAENERDITVYNPVSGQNESLRILSLGDSGTSSDSDDCRWIEIDRRFWDYDVSSEKTYYSDESGYSFTNPQTDGCEVHEMDWISFRVGNMLLNGKRLFLNGYDSYAKITGDANSKGMILVMYRKYCEFGGYFSGTPENFSGYSSFGSTVGTSSSIYRVPFGDVYNGGRDGRCIHAGTGSSMTTISLVEENDAVNSNEMNYYEGNYIYRKRIYPLMVKVLHEKNKAIQSSFACENQSPSDSSDYLIENGKVSVPCEMSWFMDDIMKPVVFERVLIDRGTPDERLIFKQLSKGQANVQYQSTNGNHYAVTLVPKYYATGIGNGHIYPSELFLVYNYTGDSLGNVLDFNYHYGTQDFESRSLTAGYGHANSGKLIAGSSLSGDGTGIFIKRDVIVSMAGIPSHDPTRDITMRNSGSGISFVIPRTAADIGSAFSVDASDTAEEKREKKRINDGFAFFSPSRGMRLYCEGKMIWDCNGSEFSGICTINGQSYPISYDDTTSTVSIDCTVSSSSSEGSQNDSGLSDIMELMLVYYEERQVGFGKVNAGTDENPVYANPFCIGYRVPCYEKVKTSTLFVSSFPNWAGGHVNNDLDVFYGNKLYSGTEITNGGLSDYHDIYPEYVRDGWYAMYPEGSIEFNEAKTEQNYFDVLNYSQFNSGDVSNEEWLFASTWNSFTNENGYSGLMPNYWGGAKKRALLYKKVKYNVAHYDGIYSVVRARMSNYSNTGGECRYALLEDDDFADSCGKRWLVRNDDSLRRMHESGHEELPVLLDTGRMEEPGVLECVEVNGGDLVVPNTADDRICVFAVAKDCHSVFLIDSVQGAYRKIDSSEMTASQTRIHVKVTGGSGIPRNCLAIGVESTPVAFPSTVAERAEFMEKIFDESEVPVNWVYLPDADDVYKGWLSDDGESYEGIGIECVQTGEITIDAETMRYWYADETEDDSRPLADGTAPLRVSGGKTDYSGGTLRRFRYHRRNDAAWSHDVCFEVFSYRYDVPDSSSYAGAGENPVSYVEMSVYRLDEE